MVNEKVETMFPDINLKLEDGLNSKDFLTFAGSISKLNNGLLLPYQEKLLHAFNAQNKIDDKKTLPSVLFFPLENSSCFPHAIRGNEISWVIIDDKINIDLNEAHKLIKLVSLGKNANLKSKAYLKIRKSRIFKNRVKLYKIYFGCKLISFDSLSIVNNNKG